MGYKVEHKVLDRIKKHLRKVKRELLSNLAADTGGRNEKVAKENDKIIKLIKDNYPG